MTETKKNVKKKPTTSSTVKKNTQKKPETKVIHQKEEVVEKIAKDFENNTSKAAKISTEDIVTVKSCHYGELIYSPDGTYSISWKEYGDEQKLTVGELLIMRNSQIGFFSNNWIIITGDNAEEVINFLRVEQYYNDYYDLSEIDSIFSKDPEEIEKIISNMKDSTKETLARRAQEKIEKEELNNYKVIKTLEKCLSCELG